MSIPDRIFEDKELPANRTLLASLRPVSKPQSRIKSPIDEQD